MLQKNTNINNYKAIKPNYISFKSLKLADNLILIFWTCNNKYVMMDISTILYCICVSQLIQ
jgi:hypothetical protein